MIRHPLRTLRTLLLLLVLAAVAFPGHAGAERDPLASVVEMPAPQIRTVPPDLFTEDQRQNLTAIVNEARLFGVPLVVRAITVPTTLDLLSESSTIAGTSPTEQQLVQRFAEEWLVKEAVETSPGAGDGILLMVIIPEDDHTQTVAAFATGPNALPLNGLTQSSLDRVLNDIIYPFFANNTIGPGIHTGVAYLSYDNLFAVPARLELNDQQETLHSLTNLGIASLTMLSVLGLGGLILWIRRRDHGPTGADPQLQSPFDAGALARGRVDASVVTAAMLHLASIGAIHPKVGRSGELVLHVDVDVPVADPFACQVFLRLAAEATSEGQVQGASMRRIQDVLMPARDWLRDDLASRGLFNRDALVESVWVVLASAGVAAVALFTLLPSMVSLSRVGIASIAIAAIAIVLALLWIVRRSWTTRTGQQALAAWRARSLESADSAVFDMIVHQDAMLETPGGPAITPSTQLVRELRGLGAG